MMRFKLILFSMFLTCIVHGQLDQFNTHFAYNQINFNPAFAGNHPTGYLTILHRDQWAGLEGAPNSQLINGSIPFERQNFGLGFVISRASLTIQEKIDVQLQYSYRIKFNSGFARMGVQIAGRRFTNDFTDDRLLAIDGLDIDPAIDRINYSQSNFNLGVGGIIKIHNVIFGMSSPRLIKANIDQEMEGFIAREARHLYAFLGSEFEISNDWTYRPQVLFKYAESSPKELDFWNAFIYRDQLHLASNFRLGGDQNSPFESIDIAIGYKIGPQWFASMAFDFTLSELNTYENGSFELMLRYNFAQATQERIIQNPRHY